MGFLDQIWVVEGIVHIRLLRSNFELRFYPPEPERLARIRERDPNDPIPIRMELVNSRSGKPVRGWDGDHINPYWLRRFVYDIAGAVSYMEREWDTLPEAYVERVEKANA